MAHVAVSASPMWVPHQNDTVASWPPKFSFCPSPTPPRSRSSSKMVVDGVSDQPRTTLPPASLARWSSKAIPNRPSRAKSIGASVPSTPTNLWQPVAKQKGRCETESAKCLLPPSEFDGAERCLHPPVDPAKIRSFSNDQLPAEPIVPPPSPRPAARQLPTSQPRSETEQDVFTPLQSRQRDRAGPPRPPTPEPAEPQHDSSPQSLSPVLSITSAPCLLLASPAPPSVLFQWNLQQYAFNQRWCKQKLRNPHLPLVVSPLNPLREAMPPFYWRSVVPAISSTRTSTGLGARIVWNIKKPLPSPALRTKLRSRHACDAAGEFLSARQLFSGKLRHHCPVCAKDGLCKRLLLMNHWVERAEVEFDRALDNMELDVEMTPVEELPKRVLLKDRDDFDEAVSPEERAMDEDPLIVERDPECHSLPLF
ncbi:hypothetical protein HMN09_00449100 [Mycena chlorophos]|uniref:Uncharacterized protein n=1 Tax=Mycena chlorophos TaxID=658473 RepID=A0A8H6WFU6_MYCCL|nr:hypothetical protein HMN09_00449100 [Mycena chlorophos]